MYIIHVGYEKRIIYIIIDFLTRESDEGDEVTNLLFLQASRTVAKGEKTEWACQATSFQEC